MKRYDALEYNKIALMNILCYFFLMKILITIPHYYNNSGDSIHGSGKKDPRPRIQALSACLFNIRSLFSPSQCMIDIRSKKAIEVNSNFTHEIDIVICTTES